MVKNEKNLDITKPRYREHILPVPWPFVKSRFHCMNKNYVALDYNNWRYDSRCFTGYFKESSTRMVKVCTLGLHNCEHWDKTKKKNGKILTKNMMGSRKVTIDTPLYRTLFGPNKMSSSLLICNVVNTTALLLRPVFVV